MVKMCGPRIYILNLSSVLQALFSPTIDSWREYYKIEIAFLSFILIILNGAVSKKQEK